MKLHPLESGSSLVTGYVALSRLPGLVRSLDGRTALMAARRAAQLGGCRWCLDRCRHDCRIAGVPEEEDYSERDQAALSFVDAVARAAGDSGSMDPPVVGRARRFFSDIELAELAGIAAEHHCLEPLTNHRSHR